jgi:hypothetical protein
MEYIVKERKHDLIKFMNNINSKLRTGEYNSILELFESKTLSSGIEGKIYKSTFKYPTYGQMIIVIKSVDLIAIKESKQISKKVLKFTSDQLYDIFKSENQYNQHSLIELIAQTLTNQLIFQKICPHFSLNYYWDYDSKTKIISSYNEFANAESFHTWALSNTYTDDIWFNALFQIMYALISIKRYYNMIHTDFHTDNILVHKVKPGGFWVYTLNNIKYYLPNLGFVFLLHDFGFAWIPKKLVVKWHHTDTLKYITDIGQQYYDISHFINSLTSQYDLPEYFQWFINTHFKSEEIDYVLTKEYYKKLWLYIKDNKSIANKVKNKYKQRYQDYPNITKSYKGNKTTLEDKFYELFYYDNSSDKKYTYNKIIKGKPIEKYSADKYLNRSKLPVNLQKLII